MYPIGLSLCGQVPTADTFAKYREAGISHMEIQLNPNDNFDRVYELAKEYGINLWSFHLPFVPFDKIDTSNPLTATHTVEVVSDLIKKAANIGVKTMVIHPSGEPIAEADRADRLEIAKDSLAKLADVAATEGSVIAVEDLPRTCLGRDSDDILALLSADDRLRVCFDTNHLLKEDPVEFVRKVGDKIVTLHVSDYDRRNERHWLPGEGVIDWQALLTALKEVGYNGPWMYEIGLKCPQTIVRRDLAYDDFVRNAHEVFENKPFTLFSSPAEKSVIDEYDGLFTFSK